MKYLLLALTALLMQTASAADSNTRTYGIHLFFNEKEFVDVLTITGRSSGTMHVPNDFDGKIENLLMFGGGIAFDLFVPKNASRPTDMVFHYRGFFFDESEKQLHGDVSMDDGKTFVATFVGFLRE